MTKRKALGKGLSALIPDANRLVDGEEQFFQCPIEAIEPNPYQPRQDFSESDMEQMVNSVREQGIITPLLVSRTDKGYQLIAGERRWRAAQQAGLDRVPVVVREATPYTSLALALIENIHRKDLNPIEEAVAYKRLLEEVDVTQESLAKSIGKDRSSVTNLLRLLKLPAFIQKDLIDGRLSMGHARILAGIGGSEEQRDLRNTFIKKELSVRQAEMLAKKKRGHKRSKSKETELDYYLQSLADNLKGTLGTKVEIKKKGREGRIVVYFYSDEELDRLLEILG
jgi:ParB family chromosome partitioning protein